MCVESKERRFHIALTQGFAHCEWSLREKSFFPLASLCMENSNTFRQKTNILPFYMCYSLVAKYHVNRINTLPNEEKYQKLLLKVAGRTFGKGFLGQVWASITSHPCGLRKDTALPKSFAFLLREAHSHRQILRGTKLGLTNGKMTWLADDPGFPGWFAVANPKDGMATYYLAKNFPKSAWKLKKLDWGDLEIPSRPAFKSANGHIL